MRLPAGLSAQGRLLRTLVDIGPRRLQRRLRYDLRQRLDRQLPSRLTIGLVGCATATPQWSAVLRELVQEGLSAPAPPVQVIAAVRFAFLNLERDLPWPIRWNDPTWPRLWQFNLHYFDWAREWLDAARGHGRWPDEARALEPLLDQWITANPPGRGDGWHSYTLSLRVRNWIWLFRSCPVLATQTRLQSLWQQLCWLQAHPEDCHGGNHWLENLIALALGGLQFSGAKARTMHRCAMGLLRRELAGQVLADGGHEERSASYHLLMLDRLVELACSLAIVTGERPPWLWRAIEAMTAWAMAMMHEGGHAPRFNDSVVHGTPPLDVVLDFAQACLEGREAHPADSTTQWWGLRQRLLQAARDKAPSSAAIPIGLDALPQPAVTDLSATGWTLLRPGHGWELAFKCGNPCPRHLPAHVHSDQLSLELSHHGRWLLSEAGTSVYDNGIERAYERSGAAHNILQLGVPSPSGEIFWIEPVEVWGCFRAGRKARPRQRQCGELPQGGLFAAGSHDGFDRLGASHRRRVELANPSPQQITLTVYDKVITRMPLMFRIWWHLAPDISEELIHSLVLQATSAEQVQASWHTTWFAEGFGQRRPRQSYCLSGSLPLGKHQLITTFPVSLSHLGVP